MRQTVGGEIVERGSSINETKPCRLIGASGRQRWQIQLGVIDVRLAAAASTRQAWREPDFAAAEGFFAFTAVNK
jgi:hypothetical protein